MASVMPARELSDEEVFGGGAPESYYASEKGMAQAVKFAPGESPDTGLSPDEEAKANLGHIDAELAKIPKGDKRRAVLEAERQNVVGGQREMSDDEVFGGQPSGKTGELSDEDVFGQEQPEGSAIGRGLAGIVSGFGKTAGQVGRAGLIAAGGVVGAVERGIHALRGEQESARTLSSLITQKTADAVTDGKSDTPLSDGFFDMAEKIAKDNQEYYDISADTLGTAGAVGETIGEVAPFLAAGVPGLIASIATPTINKGADISNRGGTTAQALEGAAGAGAAATLGAAVPFHLAGKVGAGLENAAARYGAAAAAGAGMGAASDVAGSAIENATTPEGEQFSDLKRETTPTLAGTLIGAGFGAMGARGARSEHVAKQSAEAEKPKPTPEEQMQNVRKVETPSKDGEQPNPDIPRKASAENEDISKPPSPPAENERALDLPTEREIELERLRQRTTDPDVQAHLEKQIEAERKGKDNLKKGEEFAKLADATDDPSIANDLRKKAESLGYKAPESETTPKTDREVDKATADWMDEHNLSYDDAQKAARIMYAHELDPDAVQRAADEHGEYEPKFHDEIERIIANGEKQRAKAAKGGAQRPEEAGPRAGQVEGGRQEAEAGSADAIRNEPGGESTGPGEPVNAAEGIGQAGGERIAEAGTGQRGAVERAPFPSIEEHSVNETIRRAKEHGFEMSPEQAAKIAPVHRDPVTDFYRAEEQEPVIKRAQHHVEQTGERAHYVEFDLRNLGGMNKTFTHSGANEHYRNIAKMTEEELQKTGGDVSMVRHGGDEWSAVVVNADRDAIENAAARAQQRAEKYSHEIGMSDVVNPKYKDQPYNTNYKGTGIYYGVAPIDSRPIGRILKEADSKVELAKGVEDVNRGQAGKVGVESLEGQPKGTKGSAGEVSGGGEEGKPSAEGETAADEEIEPRNLIEIHPVKDKAKFEAIASDMKQNGWQGRPIPVWDTGNGKYALTGSHRIAAAKKAGLDVPIVYADDKALEHYAAEHDLTTDDIIGSGDDKVEQILRDAGDNRSADLMEREIEENNKPAKEPFVSDAEAKARDAEVKQFNKAKALKSQRGAISIEPLGPVGDKIREHGEDALEKGKKAVREFQLAAAPMAAGTKESAAIAKTFANDMRAAEYQHYAIDRILEKEFTPEQRREMYNATEEEHLMALRGEHDNKQGFARLPEAMRKSAEYLQSLNKELVARAQKVGLLEGAFDIYDPRVLAEVADDGTLSKLTEGGRGRSLNEMGRNVTRTTPNLKERKYETAAETEAAAKAKFAEQGKDVQLIRDIRVLPHVMARLEKAIIGRELINEIKQIGKDTMVDKVVEGHKPPGFFTIDSPAFYSNKPRLENGKPVLKEDGKPVIDRVPLYISGDMEGPLKAVLAPGKNSSIYNFLMALKSGAMSFTMFSPLVHQSVIYFKALPFMPGKMFNLKLYRDGYDLRKDSKFMKESIKDGVQYVGNRGFLQDITDILQPIAPTPGQTLSSKVIGGTVGLINKNAGDATKAGIDKAGHFWHNVFLWDRIADMQAGMYKHLKLDMMARGMNESAAGKLAAHFANRFGGSIPKEDTSNAARKLMNLLLFSRSFTGTNVGIYKDVLMGLPKSVQGQILKDAGSAQIKIGNSFTRRAAAGALVKDIAFFIIGNAMLQSTIRYFMSDNREEEWKQILSEYADRFRDLMKRAEENPFSVANPIRDLQDLTPNASNEPGKESRIYVGRDKDGTAIYVKNPVGKIGEDLLDIARSPLELAKRKESTLLKPLWETITNDKGFGRKVYDKNWTDDGMSGAMHNIGRIAMNFVGAQFPVDWYDSIGDTVNGAAAKDIVAMKAIGTPLGLSFSKGAPGGPAVGEMYAAKEKQQDKVREAMPEINKLIDRQQYDEAIDKMQALGMTGQEIRSAITYHENPSKRLSGRALKQFQQHATPEQIERLNKLTQ